MVHANLADIVPAGCAGVMTGEGCPDLINLLHLTLVSVTATTITALSRLYMSSKVSFRVSSITAL